MAKIVKETIHAKGIDIGIYTTNFENEFISLTDIAKYRNEDDPRFVIQNWMRNRNTIEFLGVWEELHMSVLTKPKDLNLFLMLFGGFVSRYYSPPARSPRGPPPASRTSRCPRRDCPAPARPPWPCR